MIIYTTLKANRENDVDFVAYIDECFTPVGAFFDGDYLDQYSETDWDKLHSDFSDKEIESIVLKGVKNEAKDSSNGILRYKSFLIDVEVGYDDIEAGIQEGVFKRSDIIAIFQKASKMGFKIQKEDYGEDGYFHTYRKDDLLEKYFSCQADLTGECNNCCNCD